MIGSGMFPKAEMRATAVDGGGKVAKFYIGIGIVLHNQGKGEALARQLIADSS